MKQVYKFKDEVYDPPYAPYYDQYKGHVFVIDHVSAEDETGEHVWLSCVDDCGLVVNGYVHLYNLETVDVDVEQLLADMLQVEIWKEITADTGKTKEDLDNEIIAELIKIKKEIDDGKSTPRN